jgi:hypothetical protein
LAPHRTGAYNRATEADDWKRRSERLPRASRLPYTIVRPGWFDSNGPEEHRLVLLQGDTRQAGDSSDGVIARRQIAEVLVRSLGLEHGLRKTFELVATTGPASDGFDALFAPLDADPQGALDGMHDMANMPLEDEPRQGYRGFWKRDSPQCCIRMAVRENLSGCARQMSATGVMRRAGQSNAQASSKARRGSRGYTRE